MLKTDTGFRPPLGGIRRAMRNRCEQLQYALFDALRSFNGRIRTLGGKLRIQ